MGILIWKKVCGVVLVGATLSAAAPVMAMPTVIMDIPTLLARDKRLAHLRSHAHCVQEAVSYYKHDPGLFLAILRTENGRAGARSMNKNGTADFGPAQINSRWIRQFRERGIPASVDLLENHVCFNLYASGWILRYELDRAPDFWTGVGNYHSRTPEHHRRYIKLVHSNWDEIYRLASGR